jgi:hypothetical protein
MDAQIPAQGEQKPRGIPFSGANDPRRWKRGNTTKPKVADAFWRIANRKTDDLGRTELDELCQKVWDKAKAGDSKCATLVFNRMEGAPVQPIEDVTPQADMSPDETKRRIADLLARAAVATVNANAG